MQSQMQMTKRITYCGLFAAVATVVMFLEFPLPFLPPFLKLDLSGAVTLLAAFMFGPVPAVLITLVKDLIHFMFSTSGGVGQLADFIIISAFSVTAAIIYRRIHTRKGAMIACAAATGVMVVVGILANKYLLIPFYAKIMPIEAIFSACAKVNPLIGDLNTYLIFGAGPFNLIKGIILSLLTILLYKRLSHFIKKGSVFSKKELEMNRAAQEDKG